MSSNFSPTQFNSPSFQGNIVQGNNDSGSSAPRSITSNSYNFPISATLSTSRSSGCYSSNTSKESLSLFESDSLKRCWICFGDEVDSEGRWVKPCHCSLVSHEECLLAWINENQKGHPLKKVRCPQCNELYQLLEPASFFVDLFGLVDGLIQSTVPYITLAGLTGSVLVTSTTYGAYVVLTMCGAEDGEKLLGSPHPWGWRVWVGLPLIPWVLMGSRTTYLDSFLPLLPFLVLDNDQIVLDSLTSPKVMLYFLPWARLFYNSMWKHLVIRLGRNWIKQNQGSIDSTTSEQNNEAFTAPRINQPADWDTQPQVNNRHPDTLHDPAAYILTEKRDLARTVVGALLFPGISSITGNFLGQIPFVKSKLPDTFVRSIVGGCLFVFFKDVTNLLYKYYLVRRLRRRHVKSIDNRR